MREAADVALKINYPHYRSGEWGDATSHSVVFGLRTMFALLLVIQNLIRSLFTHTEEVGEFGPRVCVVNPRVRERLPSVSSTDSLPSTIDLNIESGLDSSSEEEFVWRRHGGGGWNGWRNYEDYDDDDWS